MRKQTIFALTCLSLVVVSVVSLPQGFAAKFVKDHSPNPPEYTDWIVGAVSGSTGGCTNLGLKGFYGDVLVARGKLMIELDFVNPSSTYSVSVAQIKDGACDDGTWTSLGSINTGQAGIGGLIQKDKLTSGWYVFEFTDSAGNLAYATSPVSL